MGYHPNHTTRPIVGRLGARRTGTSPGYPAIAMAKVRRMFVCRSCGAAQPRWLGKCPDCGTWDSLEETIAAPNRPDPHAQAVHAVRGPVEVLPAGSSENAPPREASAHAKTLGELLDQPASGAGVARRLPTGLAELDRTLGTSPGGSAGLAAGSVVLVGGEPGIGKSTLLMQAAFGWARQGVRVLYVSSEESAEQVAARASRLRSPDQTKGDETNLLIAHEANLAHVLEQVRRAAPDVLIIDSIQMLYRSELPAAPGSVTQLRRCAADLVRVAKGAGIAVVLVGHVTKDGQLAGPRLLEHMVDAVLSFEGDRAHSHRLVRAVKNRFGSTLEVGLFAMTGAGLEAMGDGSGGLGGGIAALREPPRPGCALTPVVTGTRCFLIEVQALTATGFLGAAKRKCSGLDASRLAMLIAVLEQHAELRLADRDIFASSVGGLRVVEPSADLALLLAVAGAHLRKALPTGTVVMGEVGLSSQVRGVPHLEQRVREAVRLGATDIIAPAGPTNPTKAHCPATIASALGHARWHPVADVHAALQWLETAPSPSAPARGK